MALAGKKFDAHTETEPEPGDGTVVFLGIDWGPR